MKLSIEIRLIFADFIDHVKKTDTLRYIRNVSVYRVLPFPPGFGDFLVQVEAPAVLISAKSSS